MAMFALICIFAITQLWIVAVDTTVTSGDTPNWSNGYSGANNGNGATCQDYATLGWCANGAVVPGSEWTLGAAFNYPEQNCVVCGKPANNVADTPNWSNGYSGANNGNGATCQDYVTLGWCANGAVVPGNEWTVGAAFNYPEQNCVACGKQF